MRLIDRSIDRKALLDAAARSPVTLLTDPRQVGKSTLARHVIVSSPSAFYKLEDYRDLVRRVSLVQDVDRKESDG